MDNYTILLLVIGAVAVVFIGVSIMIPHLVQKGIDVSGVLSGTATALDTAKIVIDGLQTFLPETPALTLVDKIISYAKKGTEAAEQMYKASKIEANARKEAATNIVYDCLHMAGVEVTDEVKKVVDGCIEAAVFTLPKTNLSQQKTTSEE